MERVNKSKIARGLSKIAVKHEEELTATQLMLYNRDLRPVEPERRQWGPWNYVAFWIADSFNINTWMISASQIVDGLSWWQSWICVWLGYSIAACFVVTTGRIGSRYHIPFPVVARSSFGVWGSFWPVFNRSAMACIWYGVQGWIGGTCVYLMIRSIWNNWRPDAIHNSIPESGTNTVMLVSFFLFWAGSLPALWFPVEKIRHLFTVKSYVAPTAGIALFIWAIVRAKGMGPIVHQPAAVSGSDLAWLMIRGTMASIANFAALIINNSDFARFAKKPQNALWPQLISIPMGFAITSFIGIIVSSSSTVIFGQPIWNPLDLLESFLKEGGAGQRFGVFVIAASFTLAQLGTNIAANSVAAGTDMTALLPRFINIRRGSYICATVGFVMCPWHLLSSTNSFTTYLSAYSVFLSSVAGVMICDYYWVKRGYLEVKNLYHGKKTGPYYYFHGFHLRAYAAYICGIAINIVGFAGAVGAKVPVAAQRIYDLNYFCGFIIAALVYKGLCTISPIPACSETWLEVGDDMDLDVTADSDDEDGMKKPRRSASLDVDEIKGETVMKESV